MQNFGQVFEKFFMLAPPASAALQIADEGLQALEQVRVDNFTLVVRPRVDRKQPT